MSSQMANRVDSRIYRPELAAVQFGHTKGTLFFDGQTGVWLVHSVPKFPPPDHYQYPDSGTDYGQTMLCMTFTYAQLKDIDFRERGKPDDNVGDRERVEPD
ncbi:unnamed protein product, partial [Mesorhabditis belari]|uniref:Deoxyribonuclease II n=1 Tax=Mesorhabditis belari TaxID=2138241 RepID=A0AAF3ERV4_9BILA